MAYIMRLEDLCRREEHICMALVRSLTDLAFALVRLAEIEIACEDENPSHAAELIASAGTSRKAAMEFLEDVAWEAASEKADLEERVKQLSRAIHAADWHRRQLTESIVRAPRLVDRGKGRVN